MNTKTTSSAKPSSTAKPNSSAKSNSAEKTKDSKSKSSSTKKTPPVKDKQTESKADNQLLAIRDLLFGEQVNQIESKINALNELVDARFKDIEAAMASNKKEFEVSLDQAVKSLKDALEKSHTEHDTQESIIENSISSLSEELSQFQNKTDEELDSLDKALAKASNELYKSLESEVKSLELKIENASKELSDNKADRKSLAEMLETMASNLNASKA